MKQTLISLWLGVAFSIIPLSAQAAGTAQAQLVNASVRLYPGDCSCGFGFTWTIHFSTFFTEDPPQANGEIAPLLQPATHTHWSYLVLEDPSMFASATYAELDLPLGDANGNGTPDFFEVSQPVAAGSGGTYATIWSPGFGQLALTWTRAAGARQGSCVLHMNDPILGQMGPFTHAFELTGYAGELTYSPGVAGVTGTIRIEKAGPVSEMLDGPVLFVKAETNRFNRLTLAGGNWTNQAGVFSFGDCELTRDPAHPTVYHGLLENPGGDYRSWKLSIVDTNDADGNGIPDFSDDPVIVTPPRRPALSLSSTQTHLLLWVSGDVGRTHLVQEATSPGSTNWTTVQSLPLTNDPQVLTLPLPAGGPAFWRVKAE